MTTASLFRRSMALTLLLGAACDGRIPETPAEPVCVWNAAYQENYAADTIDAILADARGCYVLVDPLDSAAAAAAIPDLQAADNVVGCYISVGTCEEWRDDFDQVREHCIEEEWPEWPGEYFVDDPDGILPAMVERVGALAGMGCDIVEFDNMDFFWEVDAVSEEAGNAYVVALCDAVRQVGMGCMAKNYRPGGADGFSGGTFESYPDQMDWWEHEHLQRFVDDGQLSIVFHYGHPDCAAATGYYRERYGSGVSVLCEDPGMGGYAH